MTKGRDLDDKDLKNISGGGKDGGPSVTEEADGKPTGGGGGEGTQFNAPTTGSENP